MDQKDNMIDRKGLKMYENRQKIEFFGPKKPCFLAEFSVAELGGTPSRLNEKSPAPKPLAEMGGTPNPLNGKNLPSSF